MDKIGNQVSMIHDIEENFSGIRSGLTGLEQNAAAISEKTRILRETNTMLVDETNTLSSTSRGDQCLCGGDQRDVHRQCRALQERQQCHRGACRRSRQNERFYRRVTTACTTRTPTRDGNLPAGAPHGIERGDSAIHADVRKKSASFCRLPGVTIRLSKIARFLPCRLEHPGSCLLPRFDTLAGVSAQQRQ